MKSTKRISAALLAASLLWGSAEAQTVIPGLPVAPLGYCQLSATQLGSAVSLSKCTRASFTASAGASSNLLVVTSVSGVILVGDTLLTGTGITAGTTVLNQVSGTPGGAGTYTISAANTASSASATSGGIPPGANCAYIEAEVANVRYRSDGGVPTASVGSLVLFGSPPGLYTAFQVLQFIAASGSPLLDIDFGRCP